MNTNGKTHAMVESIGKQLLGEIEGDSADGGEEGDAAEWASARDHLGQGRYSSPYFHRKHLDQGAVLYVYASRDGALLRRPDGTIYATKNKRVQSARRMRLVPDETGDLFTVMHRNGYFWSPSGRQAVTVFDDVTHAKNAVKTGAHLDRGNIHRHERVSPLQVIRMAAVSDDDV